MQNNYGFGTKEVLNRRYEQARIDLLIIFFLTIVNIAFLFLDGDYYMLFSAIIPYAITLIGMMFCGLLPDEFYTGDFMGADILTKEYIAIFIAIALIITVMYLIAYLLSRKGKVGWMIFSLVYIGIDSLFIFLFLDVSMIIDIIIRVLIIVSIVMGITAHYKLKNLPPEETKEEELNPQGDDINVFSEFNEEDTVPLRKANFDVKSKIFLEYESFGHKIIYRRVKRTNELVIDGNVYAEYIALMEFQHVLSARLDGHEYSAGLLLPGRSFIAVDKNIVKEKIRIV